MTTEKQTPEALLPCPFCGGKAEFERMGTSRQSCIVVCDSCGARLESSDEYQRSGSRWNDRAALASAQAQQEPPVAHGVFAEDDAASPPVQQARADVDWRGLALDLEARAKTVESQTTERAMLAAAHGLRLMGSATPYPKRAGVVPDGLRANTPSTGTGRHKFHVLGPDGMSLCGMADCGVSSSIPAADVPHDLRCGRKQCVEAFSTINAAPPAPDLQRKGKQRC